MLIYKYDIIYLIFITGGHSSNGTPIVAPSACEEVGLGAVGEEGEPPPPLLPWWIRLSCRAIRPFQVFVVEIVDDEDDVVITFDEADDVEVVVVVVGVVNVVGVEVEESLGEVIAVKKLFSI